jgi:hypothetical protein
MLAPGELRETNFPYQQYNHSETDDNSVQYMNGRRRKGPDTQSADPPPSGLFEMEHSGSCEKEVEDNTEPSPA